VSIVERAIQKAGAQKRATPVPAESDPRRSAAPKSDIPIDSSRHLELNAEALRAVSLLPPTDMEFAIAEELRLIKRPLLLNAEGENVAAVADGNVIMVASALPGAGKTFLSLNLAMSMASELDWTVLLIDGDVSRPSLSRSLGLGDAPGLVNLLEEERGDLNHYAYRTSVQGLHFLPAGPSRANVKELLGSQRMRALVAELKQRNQRQIVLFDSPPLLLTSEARVLASYVGQIVLVVEAGVTPRRSVMEAIETLDTTKAINLVLNKNWQTLKLGDYNYAGYGPYGREADKAEG
jgi:exopolysaccharide/PEP-CTERM locus tyrosine autokinase